LTVDVVVAEQDPRKRAELAAGIDGAEARASTITAMPSIARFDAERWKLLRVRFCLRCFCYASVS
jgi:hypothetical protein